MKTTEQFYAMTVQAVAPLVSSLGKAGLKVREHITDFDDAYTDASDVIAVAMNLSQYAAGYASASSLGVKNILKSITNDETADTEVVRCAVMLGKRVNNAAVRAASLTAAIREVEGAYRAAMAARADLRDTYAEDKALMRAVSAYLADARAFASECEKAGVVAVAMKNKMRDHIAREVAFADAMTIAAYSTVSYAADAAAVSAERREAVLAA